VTASALAKSSAQRTPVRVLVADSRDLGMEYVDTVVSDDDRRAAAQMSPRRRTQYLAGRALLRLAVEQSTQRPAKAHRFTTRTGGKPDCVAGTAISVSHSGSLLACAVAPAGEVGVDVQFPARHHHTEEIAREWFTPAECAWLRRAPRDAFYRLWVLKEAYLKCTGEGLAGGLASLECCVDPPVIAMRAPQVAQLALYSAGSALVGIAASTADIADVSVEVWPPLSTRARSIPVHFIAATTSA
jgi:4'-phosphopantetheinyl transferase